MTHVTLVLLKSSFCFNACYPLQTEPCLKEKGNYSIAETSLAFHALEHSRRFLYAAVRFLVIKYVYHFSFSAGIFLLFAHSVYRSTTHKSNSTTYKISNIQKWTKENSCIGSDTTGHENTLFELLEEGVIFFLLLMFKNVSHEQHTCMYQWPYRSRECILQIKVLCRVCLENNIWMRKNMYLTKVWNTFYFIL